MIRKTAKHTIEVYSDSINVTPISVRDPNWHYIDKNGHEHHWYIPPGAEDKPDLWQLPTLREVHKLVYIEEGGDEHWATHYYCKKCGELVYPGEKSPDSQMYVQGLTHYYVDGVEVSKEEAERAMKEE